MNETKTTLNRGSTTEDKVKCLSRLETYLGTSKVDILETHMSWLFLTDGYVYKLKKPVRYEFLDFSMLEGRYKYCMEEARINQPLAGDTYLSVIPLKLHAGSLQLDGKGETVDWLVKMKRLPGKYMLDTMIRQGTVKNKEVQSAAEKLTGFYLAASPEELDSRDYRQKMAKDIENISAELLRKELGLPQQPILAVTTDLLHFVMQNADLFDERFTRGKVIDCHGDLRPEHIALAPKPVIIDRIEFDSNFRIMDVGEELAFLMVECDILQAPAIGELFLNTYQWRSGDDIPEVLISFYKAKRAFFRAWLTISHLLEKKYQTDEKKWRNRCHVYLHEAYRLCRNLA